MTIKIHQQVDTSYQHNNNDNDNDYYHDIKELVKIIGYYIIHIIFHFLALNYLLIFILFKDAQENNKYMIDDVKTFKDFNLIITFSLFYFIVYVEIIYLAKIYSHHIIPIMSCSIFYGLCYLIIGLNQIIDTNCKKRKMLYCKDTNTILSNKVIFLAKDYISYALITISITICIYTICIISKNYRIKYYYYTNPIKDFIALLIMYYIFGLIIFIIPIMFCICTGCSVGNSEQQIVMANFVNGIEINPNPTECIQEV